MGIYEMSALQMIGILLSISARHFFVARVTLKCICRSTSTTCYSFTPFVRPFLSCHAQGVANFIKHKKDSMLANIHNTAWMGFKSGTFWRRMQISSNIMNISSTYQTSDVARFYMHNLDLGMALRANRHFNYMSDGAIWQAESPARAMIPIWKH